MFKLLTMSAPLELKTENRPPTTAVQTRAVTQQNNIALFGFRERGGEFDTVRQGVQNQIDTEAPLSESGN